MAGKSSGKRPYQFKSGCDPLKTPAGQRLVDANRQMLAHDRRMTAAAGAVDRRAPGYDRSVDDAEIAPDRDRKLAAEQAYRRQETADKSGFSQHLGVPAVKSRPKPKKR